MEIQKLLFLIIVYISYTYCRNTSLKFKYANISYEETNEIQILRLNNGTLNYLIIDEKDNDNEGIFRLGVMKKYENYCKDQCKLFVKPLKSTGVMNREIIKFLEYFQTDDNTIIKYTGVDEITSGCSYNKTIKIKESDTPDTLPIDGLFYSPVISNKKIIDAYNYTTIQFDAIKEKTPLARAEWVKFLSVFYGYESNATRIFEQIEETYECNRLKIKNNSDLFTKMRIAWLTSYFPLKNLWEMTDGDYKTNLLADAGAEVVTMKETSLEDLHKKLEHTHFLIDDTPHENDEDSMNEFYARYNYTEDSDLLLLKHKNILRNDGYRSTENISSWDEDFMAYPHLVLVDLIKWFHPKIGEIPYYNFTNTQDTTNTNSIWFRNVATKSPIRMTSNTMCPSDFPDVLTEKVCINVDSFKGDYSDYAMFDDGYSQIKNYMRMYWYIGLAIVLIIILLIALHYYITNKKKRQEKKRKGSENDIKNHDFYIMEEFN